MGSLTMHTSEMKWRRTPRPTDKERVRQLTEDTGFFSAEEVAIAAELIEERLAKGETSGYEFLFAEDAHRLLGYACFGRIPGTKTSFDLYWIVVAAERQRRGIGGALLRRSERLIQAANGQRLYIETSSRPQYAATRSFYLRYGYQQAALLEDFYAPGDSKVIYAKVLPNLLNLSSLSP